jgi:hypothetical protein
MRPTVNNSICCAKQGSIQMSPTPWHIAYFGCALRGAGTVGKEK